VEEIDSVLRSMQNGDIKLRVRALEAERALVRVAAVQKAQTQGMVTACAANIGTVLLVSEPHPNPNPNPNLSPNPNPNL